MLFVLVMEALNAMIRVADMDGLLAPLSDRVKNRVYLYADDVVLFLSPSQQELIVAGVILEIFGRASGLHINANKCLISPIRCDLEATVTLMRYFPGRLQTFPCNYLGIPLSTGKLRKGDLQPLVDKISSGLPTWKAHLMTRAGRCILVKVKLSAIPVHTAMAVALSSWAIECIDKRRRAFLWKGTEVISGGHCLLAWPNVCRPVKLGGLGIPNLRIMGYALRMRWLWFKRYDTTKPWAALPDEIEPQVMSMFQASVSMMVGNGKSTLFWLDKWIHGESIADLAPCLLQAVGPRIRKSRTVQEALQDRRWVRDITGGLTVQVILDYLFIWDKIYHWQLIEDVEDKPIWKWTADNKFTTASAYQAFFLGQHAIAGAKILTGTRAPGKCKFFLWLVLHDRCWTAARRKRHNLQDDDTCVLCGQESETITHLLTGCSFSRELWFSLLQLVGAETLTPTADELSLSGWWTSARKQVSKDARKSFDSFIILVSWSIWLERNNRTFNRQTRSVLQLQRHIQEQASDWVQARFTALTPFAVQTFHHHTGQQQPHHDIHTNHGRALVPM